MNHLVPNFEVEDDYSIFSSSNLTHLGKPSSFRPDDEITELLWQNGQVVMQSQNQRSLNKSPPFKLHDADHSTPGEIRSSSSPSFHKHRLHHHHHHHQEQQQSATDHLFMQEDELSSWLHYPINDIANYDNHFCAELLHPSSTTAAVAPSAPIMERDSQVSASAMESAPIRPPIPPARRNELDSARIQNFLHFSRHITEKSGPSNSKSTVMKESTVGDSGFTPAMAPESGASRANTEAASGGNNENTYANTNTNQDSFATCEVSVTSSPGGSSATAEATAQKAAPAAEYRKRKGREPDDADYHSEDAELESTEYTKKQTRGSTSTKRSRAAEVHNLSERKRRQRINEKMKALQELIPRCNKSDKASMLDEAIEYLKSLQLQVQMMSMGCGMVPMMYPGVQQYMPPMGIRMGMGMDMGIIRPMMPFPNVLAGSGLPTPSTATHLGPRFPMPAFHMPPPAPAPDPSKSHPINQSYPMLNPLGMQNLNQPGPPNIFDPYQQYIGPHQMQIPNQQSRAMARPSTRRLNESIENHPSGDLTQ